jgi:hypothetical protein
MLKSLSAGNQRVLDIANAVIGLGLLVSPWVLGYAGETGAAWNAWIVGAAATLIALAAIYSFHPAEEWANVVLGLWAVIAPWAIGFAATQAAMWVHVIAGLALAVIAAIRIWSQSGRSFSAA